MSGQALDLRRSARIVWQLKALVGAVIALGFLGGAVYTALSPAIYLSSALVAISPSVKIASQAPVVTSPPVLAAALDGVDQGIPLATLQRRIQVEGAAVGLMSIVAEADNSRQAIDTANVVARSYIAYVGPGSSVTAGPVPVQLFEAATSAEGTTLPGRLFYAAGTGVLAGVLVGVTIALAVGRANRRLRERDEIADSIGVPVLASVRVAHPARPAGWARLLDRYQPAAADAWRLRGVLRELGHSGPAGADLTPGDCSSVAVLSLSGDRKALALGPQLAAFAASQGIPATLVFDSRQNAKVTATLRAACTEAGRRGPGRLDVRVTDNDDNAVPAHGPGGGLAVVVAVVDSRAPRVANTMRATTTVLGVASGAVTAQQLARVAASAAGDGRDIAGILVADPDPADPTTGRLPQLARLGQHRMPRRMTTAVTESRQ
jgi:capsular polysaccharide biosynthesis protein